MTIPEPVELLVTTRMREDYIALLREQLETRAKPTFDRLLLCSGQEPYTCWLEALVMDARRRMYVGSNDARGLARAEFVKLTEERRKTIGLQALMAKGGAKPKDYTVSFKAPLPKPEAKDA